jgi:hypothetical protein
VTLPGEPLDVRVAVVEFGGTYEHVQRGLSETARGDHLTPDDRTTSLCGSHDRKAEAMPRTQRLTALLVAAFAVAGLVGCDSGTSPSSTELVEGNVTIPGFSLTVVPVQITRQGTLTGVISWSNFFNDVDSGILRGTCTSNAVQADVAGCRVEEALAFDDTSRRPSEFEASVTPGAHSLMIFNFGGSADNASYRLQIE